MTKLNNKGVSLIDCLIAVAVLAILVSPIISQLYTTVQVSAKAKEEQYVIDDANQIYEVFRKTKDEDLVVNLPVDDKKINNVFDNTSSNDEIYLISLIPDILFTSSLDKGAPTHLALNSS